jgi:probable addiction module antidote protein
MMNEKSSKFDVADYLENYEDFRAFLEAAVEDGSDRAFVRALSTVARAKGMDEAAQLANISKNSLPKILSDESEPNHYMVEKLLKG